MNYDETSKVIREQHAAYIGTHPDQLIMWLQDEFAALHKRLDDLQKQTKESLGQ